MVMLETDAGVFLHYLGVIARKYRLMNTMVTASRLREWLCFRLLVNSACSDGTDFCDANATCTNIAFDRNPNGLTHSALVMGYSGSAAVPIMNAPVAGVIAPPPVPTPLVILLCVIAATKAMGPLF